MGDSYLSYLLPRIIIFFFRKIIYPYLFPLCLDIRILAFFFSCVYSKILFALISFPFSYICIYVFFFFNLKSTVFLVLIVWILLVMILRKTHPYIHPVEAIHILFLDYLLNLDTYLTENKKNLQDSKLGFKMTSYVHKGLGKNLIFLCLKLGMYRLANCL